MMVGMQFSQVKYWRVRMLPEDKKRLEEIKVLNVREGTPEDLTVAIQTFIQQAVIIGEHELDSMPPEYMQNLLEVMGKYPEYNRVTLNIIDILKKRDVL